MKSYIFPGQGSQLKGMGKSLYDGHTEAKTMFEKANQILGFRLSDVMFEGSDDDLKQTKITQPAIFAHSVIAYFVNKLNKPNMLAGHSLGEFSALCCAEVISFEEALQLVYVRSQAMQEACTKQASTMAAVLALDEKVIDATCADITKEGNIVVVANYNCPGQIVISGTLQGIDIACEKLKAAGAKRVLKLPVSGAFHSPLMQEAQNELAKAIEKVTFKTPLAPIYQNVTAMPETNPDTIRKNLTTQVTSSVQWIKTIENMVANGATHFVEIGPGKVLNGLVNKINNTVTIENIS